ncbi:unnamed protein product, partial [Staurois parvus]
MIPIARGPHELSVRPWCQLSRGNLAGQLYRCRLTSVQPQCTYM